MAIDRFEILHIGPLSFLPFFHHLKQHISCSLAVVFLRVLFWSPSFFFYLAFNPAVPLKNCLTLRWASLKEKHTHTQTRTNTHRQSVFLRKAQSLCVSWENSTALVSASRFQNSCTNSLLRVFLAFHFPAWYGHLHCGNKTKLRKLVSMANKIVEILTQLHTERMGKKVRSILADSSHPLFSQCQLLSSMEGLWSLTGSLFISCAISVLAFSKWVLIKNMTRTMTCSYKANVPPLLL